MSTAGVKVLFVGRSWDVPYDVKVCEKPTGIFLDIASFMPDVIVTSEYIPGALNGAAFELRKRWIHLRHDSAPEQVVTAVESCYASNLWGPHPYAAQNPLVSVYTGTYNTGDYLHDTYQSLRDQTYSNWEWIVVDDGSTDGTWDELVSLNAKDHRVRPFKATHNGKIGNTKDLATRLCNGDYLVELDHDDMLVDVALEKVKNAFDEDPGIGMVYTNCACFFADGSPQMYTGEFWESRYRDVEYRGKMYKEAIQPNIYDRFGPDYWLQFGFYLTVGPNHIRAYRAATLRELGGYNRNLSVADDWDVFARMFLYSKCHHINELLYLYRFHDAYTNTTFTRNKSIQDHMELGRAQYAAEFDRVNKLRLSEPADRTVGDRISILLLDWNGEEMTKNCITSIKDNYPEAEIILGFSGKPYHEPRANKTVKLELNLYYAGGMNRLAHEATRECLCVLNNDTIIRPGFFEKLVDELDNDSSVGLVGPYVSYGRPPQGNYAEGAALPGKHDMESLAGFCYVLRTELFHAIGGFDPRFRSSDDDDFCKRIYNNGLKCRLVDVWLDHIGHAAYNDNNEDVNPIINTGLRQLRMKWPVVRVIAITYNEMDALPGFVEQYHRAGFHDISILDSGSTDGTVEWAKDNGIRVQHSEFTDFASQRNKALERFAWRYDVDWVIMHDPDERIDLGTLQQLWEVLRNKQYDIFLLPLQDSEGRQWVAKPVIFRADPEIKWVFPVHEKLIGSYRQAVIKNSMNTHHLEYHTAERRQEMSKKYDELGADSAEISCEGFPILNYGHRTDDRIAEVFLGPKVSIIIPTYDREELLIKAVLSACLQTYLSKEIIVVGDSCPTLPGELDAVCLSELAMPPIVTRNLPKNHGAGGAVPRNYGIMLAGGDWIAYLDDDNQWKPNHLETAMTMLRISQAEFCVTSMEVDGVPMIFDEPAQGKMDTSCLIHSKDLVRRYGWWNDRTEANYWHDWSFVRPWVEDGVTWCVTNNPSVLYNKDTSGQKEFLEQRIAEVSNV